jgi:transcriptional regulator with XRE-family HTH domain
MDVQRREMAMFNLWLRRRMAARGVDSRALAKMLNVEPATVGRWLHEGRLPDRKNVLRLARYFGVAAATILKLTDPEEFFDLATDEGRQEELTNLLADVPEMREVADKLKRLSPERRAAWLMLLNGEEGSDRERSQ